MPGKTVPKRIIKQEHGDPNPILQKEEEAMLAKLDQALASSPNPQVIGRNGELPIISFFNRYLPYTLRAATGHFIPPSGELSPQIDVMILDARYPLLSQNPDNTVLAMLHSVVMTIEVKTRMSTRDIQRMWENGARIMALASEVPRYGSMDGWGSILNMAFSYRANCRINTLEKNYEKYSRPRETSMDITLLRLPEQDQRPGQSLGIEFHYEPLLDDYKAKNPKVLGWSPTSMLMRTPLSDLYYQVIHNSYYTLAERRITYDVIGQQISDYLTWSTVSWEDYNHAYPRSAVH